MVGQKESKELWRERQSDYYDKTKEQDTFALERFQGPTWCRVAFVVGRVAVIPYEAYRRLVEEAEMLQDIRAYDEAKKAIEEGEDLIPSEVTYAILDGANPNTVTS